ncbi:hypothetical protein D3C83_56130 [compost metagenome]
MSRAMMSGPDPGALPMMSRIGLSGNADCAGCAACATGAARSAGMEIAVSSFAICIWILLLDLLSDESPSAACCLYDGSGASG